jgi:hypothetical protein
MLHTKGQSAMARRDAAGHDKRYRTGAIRLITQRLPALLMGQPINTIGIR